MNRTQFGCEAVRTSQKLDFRNEQKQGYRVIARDNDPLFVRCWRKGMSCLVKIKKMNFNKVYFGANLAMAENDLLSERKMWQ